MIYASYLGFILTSQRSVESIKEAVETLPDAWKERRHYCVGVQTCETAVKLLGLTNIAGQDCGNATNLSALIVEGKLAYYTPKIQFNA